MRGAARVAVPDMVALAQGGAAGSDTASVLVWAGALVGVVVVLTAALMVVRRRMLGRGHDEATGAAGLLDGLRAMHEAGNLSDAEYAAAKRRLAERAGAARRPGPSG